ncbi:unnamed protein product [Ixodes hexagonus]
MFLRVSTTLATVCVVCFLQHGVADGTQTTSVRLSNDSPAVPEVVSASPSKVDKSDEASKSSFPESSKGSDYPVDEADEDESAGSSNETEVSKPTVRRGYARLAFNNCGEDTDPLFVTGFDLEPNPVQIPGPLSVGIRFKLNENLTSPISVRLEMQKKLTFLFGLSTWLTIPCLPNGVGSCTYDDICDIGLFAKGECLDTDTSKEIPCQCPFYEGEWRLKPSTFKVPELPPDLPSYLLDGEFFVKATVHRGQEQIGCYSTDVELNL